MLSTFTIKNLLVTNVATVEELSITVDMSIEELQEYMKLLEPMLTQMMEIVQK